METKSNEDKPDGRRPNEPVFTFGDKVIKVNPAFSSRWIIGQAAAFYHAEAREMGLAPVKDPSLQKSFVWWAHYLVVLLDETGQEVLVLLEPLFGEDGDLKRDDEGQVEFKVHVTLVEAP